MASLTFQEASRAVQALARAAARDGARASDAEDVLENAINAVLVLAGVRPAARLDHHRGVGPAFSRALKTLAVRSGRPLRLQPWGPSSVEPPVVDTQRCSARDIATVVEGSDSDLTPTISAAMGRLLGYRCPYRESDSGTRWKGAGVIALTADVQRVDAGTMGAATLWLAGFGCARGEDAPGTMRRMVNEWGQASSRALAGSIIRVAGVSWLIVGFRVTLEKH